MRFMFAGMVFLGFWLSLGASASAYEVVFLHPEINGSPVMATDSAGGVLWERVYRPFGEISEVVGGTVEASIAQSVSYGGYEQDFESGLLYSGGRYYDPQLGIFYGVDPAEPVASMHRAQNRYIYSFQSPHLCGDPDGRIVETVTDIVSVSMGIHAIYSWDTNTTYLEAGLDVVGLGVDVVAMVVPGVPAGASAGLKMSRAGRMVGKAQDASTVGRLGSKADDVGEVGRKVASEACGGGACKKVCFVAGTKVLSGGSWRFIENIEVGDRVQTLGVSRFEQAGEVYRAARLTVYDAQNPAHLYAVEILRPLDWFLARDIESVGDSFYLELSELGVSGFGVVEQIGEEFVVADGPGRMVLMTVEHMNNDVYDVSFVEGEEALRGTGSHPLYSLDRDDWVRIRDLQVGERLQTAEAAVTVEALEKVRGVHRVYNLEVEGDHEYLVGEAGVRAHNTCTKHTVSGSRPPNGGKTGEPNSIWEQQRADGSRSVTYFDEKGRRFSREDYGQKAPHGDLPTRPDGRTAPHEHRYEFGPQGPTGKSYRELDDAGRPFGPWRPD